MAKERLNLRIEIGRLNKLRELASKKKKTMTQIVEDWLDTLDINED